MTTFLETGVFSGNLSQARKRKRKPDKENWTRNLNKTKRMHGESYIGFSIQDLNSFKKQKQDVQRQGKKLKPTCSSIACVRSKLRHCSKFTEQRRTEIFNHFWKQLDWGQKKAFICSSVDIIQKKDSKAKIPEESKRNDTFVYYLKLEETKMQVCQAMFLATLGVGRKLVHNWVTKSVAGIPTQNSTTHNKPKSVKETGKSARLFLSELPTLPSHYCRASSTKNYLEPDINSKSQLYELYKKYCSNKGLQAASRFQLNHVFDEMNMGIFSPKKDQCDTCCSYKVGQISEAEFKLHTDKKNRARTEKDKDKCLAAESKCHVITMDVESVKLSPMLKASALYYKTKLIVHNFTIYDLKTHDVTCYWWDESEGELVASTFATCLVDFITRKYKNDDLPIIIFSDGCTNQNRNAMMANALLNLAITQKRTIFQKFLEKGHTQMECDSVHSAIECELKNKTIYIPTDYVKICQDARSRNPYETIYLSYNFFKDFSMKKNQWYASIRPGTKAGDPCVTDIRVLKYSPEGKISYKLDHGENDWKEVPAKPKPMLNLNYPALYTERTKITNRKYKDLQDLKVVIPPQHHNFYDNLQH